MTQPITSLSLWVLVGLALLAAPTACGVPDVEGDGESGEMAGSEASVPRVSPVNIAHRGASAYAPEHTLAAYRLAIEMGADFVEQDLQLTKDGVLVCLHDTTLERTTNVAELFPDRAVEIEVRGQSRHVWRVSDFTLVEIKQLDAGSWFDEKFAGEPVPTFQEAIDLVKGKAGIYPETKAPEAYDSLGFMMEEEVARLLAQNGLDTEEGQTHTPVYIQSFSSDSLKQMRALTGSTYRLVQLVSVSQADLLSTDGLKDVLTYASGVGPALALLRRDPSVAAAARAVGLEIHPYTVSASEVPDGFADVTAYMRYLFTEVGATGVFTNNPDLFPRRM
jgi:glycerophosphoryl diester phosphodiesterase